MSGATIIKNDDGTYEMWYSGGIFSMNHGVGYATSPDGIDWTRDADNPIFHKDDGFEWRSSRSYTPAVIKTGNFYQMWFAGKGSGYYSIGYATAGELAPNTRELKQEAISTLEGAKTGEKKWDDKLDKAIGHIDKSLNIDPKHPGKTWKKYPLWVDDNHLDPKHGKKVFDDEKKAVKELKKLIKKDDTPQDVKDVCQAVIDMLLEADGLLAHTAYDEALDGAGDPKVDKELEKCDKEFDKAIEDLNHLDKNGDPDPKYEKAIDHYKKAWEHAQKALKHMAEDDEE